MSRALEEDTPQIFFQTLRECGALARIMPELDALFGVPQRPEYHPEIDTGVHTLLALEQICRLSPAAHVRLAVVLHDLGKGATAKDEWPRHHDHELRGLPLIRKFCQRLAVPKQARDLALAVAEFHTHCHRAMELTPKMLVQTLEKLDAFRRPERFAEFLLCCEADARGRTGLENRPYPQTQYFAAALSACSQVKIADLMEKGLAGAGLGKALRDTRVETVKRIKTEWQTNNKPVN